MKKIAFIIVRYGENINGGAEVHCQMLAERLLPYYEVEVLTTTIRAFIVLKGSKTADGSGVKTADCAQSGSSTEAEKQENCGRSCR